MMTLVMTLIPLLFIGSFNLLVINISEMQDSASIKGAIYAAEGIAFMLGTVVVKYIGIIWRTSTILFFFAFVIGFAELILIFADIPFLSVIAFAVFGFQLVCFFPTAYDYFPETNAKSVSWTIFLIPKYAGKSDFPSCFISNWGIIRFNRLTMDGCRIWGN